MDTNQSLEIVRDFANRIESMATGGRPTDERFIRELLADIAGDCPMHVLKEIAECVLAIRLRELERAGQQN